MEWATDPFDRFIEYFQEINKVLDLSVKGIHGLRNLPQLSRALIDHKCVTENRQISKEEFNEIKMIQEESDYAIYICDTGFPLLHAHSIVAIWAALETLIEDLALAFIINEPKKLKRELVDNISIPYYQFIELELEEKSKLFLELLEQKLKSKIKPGIARFEAILDVLDLGGAVPEDIKRDLFEMYNIRNVIVHRSSIADKKLLSNCPWLTYNLTEKILITRSDYDRYSNSIEKYVIILINRVKNRLNRK